MNPATVEDVMGLERRLKRIEQQVDEIFRLVRQMARRDGGPAPAPDRRKQKKVDGQWFAFLEGTGWVPTFVKDGEG